ncbi:unnamed protein product, partial [marine sediment metagenome]
SIESQQYREYVKKDPANIPRYRSVSLIVIGHRRPYR